MLRAPGPLALMVALGLFAGPLTSRLAAAPARPAPPAARPADAPPPSAAPRARASTPPARLVLRGGPARVEASGEYGGVTPGFPTMPRIVLPRAAATTCYVTWTGFQLLPTGSRVFLQLNRLPDKSLRRQTGEILVDLPGCRVHRWNNLRRLDLQFFDTPVSLVKVRWNRRQGATLQVKLKGSASPEVSVVQLQGWTYLFLTFRHARKAPAPPRPRPAPPKHAPRPSPRGPNPP